MVYRLRSALSALMRSFSGSSTCSGSSNGSNSTLCGSKSCNHYLYSREAGSSYYAEEVAFCNEDELSTVDGETCLEDGNEKMTQHCVTFETTAVLGFRPICNCRINCYRNKAGKHSRGHCRHCLLAKRTDDSKSMKEHLGFKIQNFMRAARQPTIRKVEVVQLNFNNDIRSIIKPDSDSELKQSRKKSVKFQGWGTRYHDSMLTAVIEFDSSEPAQALNSQLIRNCCSACCCNIIARRRRSMNLNCDS